MGKKKNILYRVLISCPPHAVILGGTALWFLVGLLAGKLMRMALGGWVDEIAVASLAALVVGYLGSLLFLVRKPAGKLSVRTCRNPAGAYSKKTDCRPGRNVL